MQTKAKARKLSERLRGSIGVLTGVFTKLSAARRVKAQLASPAAVASAPKQPQATGVAPPVTQPAPIAFTAAAGDAARSERERIIEIQQLAAKSRQFQVGAECIADGCTVGQASIRIIEAQSASRATHLSEILASEAALIPPSALPRTGAESDAGSPASVAQSVARLLERHDPAYRQREGPRTDTPSTGFPR